ncbi:entericidin A/B family lipoprotein [Stakelama marina]|uniref:Entericidin A/B family lipoprotein n=1 Tax=Stakelama marina TaxID=2826939 RepID=A0A8T4I9G5_9SPHN|nr:entericidin A/B family lipoprotein [Stakelama marina]MBR0551150.1 entericidin A/B family lipoprotein [Stakelama marina]
MRKRKIMSLAMLAGTLLVAACNTVEGVGKDVASAGDTVANTADDAK